MKLSGYRRKKEMLLIRYENYKQELTLRNSIKIRNEIIPKLKKSGFKSLKESELSEQLERYLIVIVRDNELETVMRLADSKYTAFDTYVEAIKILSENNRGISYAELVGRMNERKKLRKLLRCFLGKLAERGVIECKEEISRPMNGIKLLKDEIYRLKDNIEVLFY